MTVVGTLLILFGIIEGGARIVWSTMPHPFHHHHRLSNEALLKHDWYSRDFFDAPLPDPGFWTPRDSLLLFPRDYQNDYQTVQRGIRRTTGFDPQRHSPDAVVAILGGSTVFCAEVPDDYTLPSMIQQSLASKPDTDGILVWNWGVSSVHSLQELERLKYEVSQGNKPDVAIFFHGVNDVFNGIFNGDPEGAIMIREIRENKPGVLADALKLRSGRLYRTLRNYYLRQPWLVSPAGLDDPLVLSELAEKTAAQYRKTINETLDFCNSNGITPVWVLQPAIPTASRELTPHEQSVMEPYSEDVFRIFEAGYPLLRQALQELQQRGAIVIDASDAFAPHSVPVFLDMCHVESDGNRILAETILQRLPDNFWAPDSNAGINLETENHRN